MRQINFITSNTGKIHALERALRAKGVDAEVIAKDLNLIEPQFDTVAEVSAYKARQAFEMLKKPVLVEDGGFCIEALNDFPGVYTKYVISTLGVDGIMKLMEGQKNRRARFVGHATFIDENGTLHSFARLAGDILISEKASTNNSPLAWSDLWKIVYVEEFGKCLSDMSEEEVNRFYDSDQVSRGSIQQFASWYAQNSF